MPVRRLLLLLLQLLLLQLLLLQLLLLQRVLLQRVLLLPRRLLSTSLAPSVQRVMNTLFIEIRVFICPSYVFLSNGCSKRWPGTFAADRSPFDKGSNLGSNSRILLCKLFINTYWLFGVNLTDVTGARSPTSFVGTMVRKHSRLWLDQMRQVPSSDVVARLGRTLPFEN